MKNYCKVASFFLTALLTAYFIKGQDEFWLYWGLCILLYLAVQHGWKDSNESYELLCELSDDINEIKKKVGLPTVNRTPKQRKQDTLRYIQEEVYRGKSLESFRKDWGFWSFHKYKNWIKIYIDQFHKGKFCPNCEELYGEEENECETCKIKLLSTKEKIYKT